MVVGDVTWLGASDGFWGSLLGSLISGVFAVLIFQLGLFKEKVDSNDMIKNSNAILLFVHENIKSKIQSYIDGSALNQDMSDEMSKTINEILDYNKYLNHIDFKYIYHNINALKNTIDYISAYNQLTEIIKDDNYGYILVKHLEDKITGRPLIETVINAFEIMNNISDKLK